ncbi:MAG: pyridoxamine 5'-phosphate oxidase family protein [Clostridia bacterium]|nr:pyridoxamine 5'-phosphate oxidase family protein [Clostridia bacterium]
MFRKMRRSPQALTEEEIKDVLTRETRGVLSVQGDDGYPYGFPINHFYDEETGKVYFHGANFGHHIDAIRRDPKVSFCVFGQDFVREGEWAKNVKSVIIFGKAELIEDLDEVIRICRKLCDKFPCPPEYIEAEIEKDAKHTMCIALTIEDINGKLVNEA